MFNLTAKKLVAVPKVNIEDLVSEDMSARDALLGPSQEDLGSGSFGQVTACIFQAAAGPIEVAVKRIPARKNDPNFREKILNEAKMMIALRAVGANVPAVYKVFFDPKLKWAEIVMEKISGTDLLQKKLHTNLLHLLQKIIKPILEYLILAQKAGILIRDLKPDDIILTDTNSLVFLDQGLSIFSSQAQGQYPAGSIRYVAPEVLDEDGTGYTYKNPIFSVGIILALLLSSIDPFKKLTDHIYHSFPSHNDKKRNSDQRRIVKLENTTTTFSNPSDMSYRVTYVAKGADHETAMAFYRLFKCYNISHFNRPPVPGEPFLQWMNKGIARDALHKRTTANTSQTELIIQILSAFLSPVDIRPTAEEALDIVNKAISSIYSDHDSDTVN